MMTKLLTRPGIGQTANLWTTIRQLVDRFGATAGHTHAGQAGEGPTLANAAIALTYTGWTPAVSQAGAVAATVTVARYCQVGKLVIAHTVLAITAAGTGGQKVTVTLPVNAAGTGRDLAFGHIYGVVAAVGTHLIGNDEAVGTVSLFISGGNYYTTVLANGDIIYLTFAYEAA